MIRRLLQRIKCAMGRHGRGRRLSYSTFISSKGKESYTLKCPHCCTTWTRRYYPRKRKEAAQ